MSGKRRNINIYKQKKQGSSLVTRSKLSLPPSNFIASFRYQWSRVKRNVDWNGIERARIDRRPSRRKIYFRRVDNKTPFPSLAPCLDWILLSKCLFASFWPIGKLIEKGGREELLPTVISWQGMHVCVVAMGRRSVFHSISSACLFFFFSFFLTNMLLTTERQERENRTSA